MATEFEAAGVRLMLKELAQDKRRLLAQHPLGREQRRLLRLVRDLRRSIIGSYRQDFDSAPRVQELAQDYARSAWSNRLGKSIMDPDIVNPNR